MSNLALVLVVLLIAILLGVVPLWPHSSGWGYGPTGGVGVLIVILLVLITLGVV
jgi:hypothetical protein